MHRSGYGELELVYAFAIVSLDDKSTHRVGFFVCVSATMVLRAAHKPDTFERFFVVAERRVVAQGHDFDGDLRPERFPKHKFASVQVCILFTRWQSHL